MNETSLKTSENQAIQLSASRVRFSFVSRWELQSHEMVHAKKKLFSWVQNNCNFVTKRRLSLRSHQDTHSNVRAFRCPRKTCTYAAKLRNSLRQHLLTHSEAKAYKCEFEHCNYASNSKQRLTLHRVVHSTPGLLNATTKIAIIRTNINTTWLRKCL